MPGIAKQTTDSTAPGPLPVPRILHRSLDADTLRAAEALGLGVLAARILAGRIHGAPTPEHLRLIVSPSVRHLDHYRYLPDIEAAASRIADAILSNETIAIASDHDCDGVTGHAVALLALHEHFSVPKGRLQSWIGHRLREGYGLTESLVERILASPERPGLLITVDHGSSDEPRIRRLRDAGIDVIVTDHHALPEEGPPPSAYACVTPQAKGCQYPDPTIAGCMVAWLLMCAVRQMLIELGRLPYNSPSLADLLDFVALGTVADCVSLASANNRSVVTAGMRRIDAGTRPCWRAARRFLWGEGPVTATDLAFSIGPRVNACGRMDDAMVSLRFLLADTDEEAEKLADVLEGRNRERKSIEQRLLVQAMHSAREQAEAGHVSLVIWLPEGHAGVHGIVASRVAEAFGRPVICLSPKDGVPGIASGSARTAHSVHIRDALQHCADADPDLFEAFGGHAGAGGLSIQVGHIERLLERFEHAVRAQGLFSAGPVLVTDGDLVGIHPSVASWKEVEALDPFGRGFEPPVFHGRFEVLTSRKVGNDGQHLQMRLKHSRDGWEVPAIWFNHDMELKAGNQVRLVFRLACEAYNGSSPTLKLQVRCLLSAS